MTTISQVPVGSMPPERFEQILERTAGAKFLQAIEAARSELRGVVIWNINSTSKGGGVAEMLRSLLAYARGSGVDTRWVTIGGTPDFFKLTKRLHNHLHGAPGDGGPLGKAERATYEAVADAAAREMTTLIQPGDIVLVHDPQPAGLCGPLKDAGAKVIWRCHIGLDQANDLIREAWAFLRPYVEPADEYVFSRISYAWEGLPEERITVVPPSIDAFSPKNQEMSAEVVQAILSASGIIPDGGEGHAVFRHVDGSPARVDSKAVVYETKPTPYDAQIVVQVSRWDRLKDPLGVIKGFADHVVGATDAHLVYAGPAVEAVSDDPEGAEVLEEACNLWEALPTPAKERVHLACLPMDDGDENAAIVNALQRRADVVVQKSIAEGFGLTVSEAMWKGRPVVATRIGGIQDQITDDTGVLIDDPQDLEAYGAAVSHLLADPERAATLGAAARERVRDRFLGPRHLMQYLDIFRDLRRR